MAVAYVVEKHCISERRACRALALSRSTLRYEPVRREDEDEVRQIIIYLVSNFGRVGYRMVTNAMKNMGIGINHKRVYRIWRQEGLKRPAKQTKRARIALNDGSCVRLRAEHKNHVWSYDFMEDKTTDGKRIRFLNIIDEYTRECLASIPARHFKAKDVIEALADIIIKRGCPEYIRSDNGPEFIAKVLRSWLSSLGITTTYIEPGSPWENGYIESFNSRMRDEFLNGELFCNMHEVRVLTKRWVRYYNGIRPHSSLGGRPPAPQSYCIPLEMGACLIRKGIWKVSEHSEEGLAKAVNYGWN